MIPKVVDTNTSIREPEVQEMLKRLSTYGLGVFVPHMHTETGEFVRLPPDMVQFEDDLKVSFKLRSEVSGGAVGWVWNNETMAGAVCRGCSPQPEGGAS